MSSIIRLCFEFDTLKTPAKAYQTKNRGNSFAPCSGRNSKIYD
nr:MAG TPA: hypothetical protein [Inoviridae sp.]